MVLDSGLNNLKATFNYQIMQKQLIQTAVQQNYLAMTPYQLALCEIELLEQEGIRMPNGVIDYSQFTSGPKLAIDGALLKKVKS